jgi:asparagine synthase (glutamine-hydrolysing)
VWPISKIKGYVKQAKIPLPDRLESYNFLTRTPLGDIFEKDFLAEINADDPLNLLRNSYSQPQTSSSLNRMLFLDLQFTLADNDLRKVNRMCELAGVDVKFPLLDEDIVRFSAALPPHLKVNGFKLRYFFKQALRDFLPSEILTKSKHGFGLPFGIWMDEHPPLRQLSMDSLSSLRGRNIIKAQYLDNLQKHHREHKSYYGVMIWVLVMLEQWLQSHHP